MPVTTDVSKVEANGNDVATVFSFNPVVIYEASDLQVYKTAVDGTITLLTEGVGPTNYSISVASYPGTGSVTYPATGVTRLATGEVLTMIRTLPYEQGTRYTNQRAYFPDAIEKSFDYLTMLTQQLLEISSRSVQVPIGDPTDPQDLIDQIVAAAAVAQDAADVISGLNVVPATESQAGFSKLSTKIQAIEGSDDTTNLTPLKLAQTRAQGANIVCANTVAKPLDANRGGFYFFTGNTQVNTIFAGDYDGQEMEIQFTGTPILSTSGNLSPPGGANYTCVANVKIRWRWDTGTSKWVAMSGVKADGTALVVAAQAQKLVAYTYAEYTTNADLTTALPVDDTAPVITEGTQILSQNGVTSSATQVVDIEVTVTLGYTASTPMGLTVWRGSTCVFSDWIQPAGGAAAAGYSKIGGRFRDSPGAAGTYTYTVRVGANAGGAGSCRANGTVSGRLGNGTARSAIALNVIEP